MQEFMYWLKTVIDMQKCVIYFRAVSCLKNRLQHKNHTVAFWLDGHKFHLFFSGTQRKTLSPSLLQLKWGNVTCVLASGTWTGVVYAHSSAGSEILLKYFVEESAKYGPHAHLAHCLLLSISCVGTRHTHLFTHCLWLLSCYNSRDE